MAAPGRSAIVTAAVMIAGSLAWVAGISLAGLEGSRGFFGAGPLIADANLILEIFLVAGITYGFLLARRGNIEAHQINQTTWVVLNIGLIALVMAGSMEDVKIELEHAVAGKMPLVASPMRFSGTPLEHRLAPPVLGQHTEEILREVLRVSDREIARLRADGVI